MSGIDPIAGLENRVALLEQQVARLVAQDHRDAVDYTLLPNGRRRVQRFPKFWHDVPVRTAVIARHRRMTIAQAVAEIAREFGPERAPSKSALQRVWKALDGTR